MCGLWFEIGKRGLGNYPMFTVSFASQEREAADIGRKEAQRECDILRERLDASQRAWNATKRELEDKTRVYSSFDRELR